MDLTCTHVLCFEQKSVTNLFVLSVSYHIYSCENNQYIVKVAYCILLWSHIIEKNILPVFEPRCEKTGLRVFRPSPTQTELYSHRRWLKA